MSGCPHLAGKDTGDAVCPHLASNGDNFQEKSPAAAAVQLEPIPQPPQHLFGLLGNLPDMDPTFPFKEIWRLLDLYGPILKLNLDKDRIFIGSQELVNELCDQKRFQKAHLNILEEVRALLYDGLFSAYNEEPNWGKAHRLLVPVFGPIGIRKMWGGMQDIASQMILRWDRLGPDNIIDPTDDCTRLAFDTIALCAFSYRFNQFYLEHVHSFAQQMADVLTECGRKANRPTFLQPLYRTAEQQRQHNVAMMHEVCDQIVADRIKNPQPDNPDLLNVMLNSADRETGEKLSPENIRYQLCTFLVAGHETTSATLCFTYYNLIKNPDKMLKAQKQVDEIVGDSVLSLEHAPKLDYIDACIKETLRLNSPINGSTLASKEDQVLGGKFFIPAGQTVTFAGRNLHRDPKVWGDDAGVFRPERMLDGGFQRLPPNSWKPFGVGARSCIGRTFAEQEMIINVAMVLQRFQLEMADPTYELEMKSTLTIKPKGFKMKVRRRPGKSLWVGIPGGVQEHPELQKLHASDNMPKPTGSQNPLHIYFGGNTGTCEALAQTLETAANAHGFNAVIDNLDSATEHIPAGPVVVISASYEGLPPDNAKKFVAWLEGLKYDQKPLKEMKCAVFGVGNSDWASTFHRIPKLIHELTAKAGATSIVEPGFLNVKQDPIGPFEDWLDKLIPALSDGTTNVQKPKSTIEVNIQQNPSLQKLGTKALNYGTIMVNKELADAEIGPAKRHIEVRLPQGASYSAGDYLVVHPHNHPDDIHRVTAFFGIDEHDMIQIKGSAKKHLPSEPTFIGEFLSTAVELGSPITKRQLENIVDHTPSERRDEVKTLVDSHPDLLAKRFSVLDVLEHYSLTLPFGEYIDMLPVLSPRQYSISSSALRNPDTVSLTIDVHESPAKSGHGVFHGVASTFLASRLIGDRITCFVRPTQVGFHIPPPQTPLILVAAGTGIAPMRAFLEERAAIAEAGTQELGPAVLYFGCRDEKKDFIYHDQLLDWEQKGIVKIKPAFSRAEGKPHQYVPDVMWENKDEIGDMFQSGGKIFLCGSAARLGQSTAEVCKKIYSLRTGKSADEAESWLQSVKTDRYVADVY